MRSNWWQKCFCLANQLIQALFFFKPAMHPKGVVLWREDQLRLAELETLGRGLLHKNHNTSRVQISSMEGLQPAHSDRWLAEANVRFLQYCFFSITSSTSPQLYFSDISSQTLWSELWIWIVPCVVNICLASEELSLETNTPVLWFHEQSINPYRTLRPHIETQYICHFQKSADNKLLETYISHHRSPMMILPPHFTIFY